MRGARPVWLAFAALLASVDIGWDFAHPAAKPDMVMPVVLGAFVSGFVVDYAAHAGVSNRFSASAKACAIISLGVLVAIAVGYTLPGLWRFFFVLALAAGAIAMTFWPKMKGAAQ